MDRKEVIAALLTNGSEKINNLKIKNVTVTPLDNYVRVSFTIDKKVKRFIDDGNGNFVEGESNIIITSLYAVAATLRENDNLSFAVNHILENPKSLEVLLSRGVIDVILEPVSAGQEYKNPWSDNPEPVVFEHDTIIAHVVNIVPGPMADAAIARIAESMLGI